MWLGLLPTLATSAVISEDTEWSGSRQVRETVRVEKGATLVIAPGSQLEFIDGHLEVSGTLVADRANFSGANWQGLVLNHNSSETKISDSKITGAQTGILITGGAPQLTGVVLENNQVGIELKQQAKATLDNCSFRNNGKVGLFVKEGSNAIVSNNLFTGNGKFGSYIYRANPERFANNRFTNNEVGLMIAYLGSQPTIEKNQFRDNRIAIHVDRAATPQLLGNLLEANDIGIKLQRRADPLVKGNRLQKNKLGMLICYSSYPQIVGNDFLDNQLALQLEHQSTSWERANGAASREQERIAHGAFGSKKQPVVDTSAQRLKKLDGTIDARNNWWGATESQQIASTGTDGNLPFIHDGLDQPLFHDAGKDYPLDRVRFYPAAQQPQFAESD
ncbi:right-handed parallel beta-helix repeat-containing protein [Malonomonas rubra]|uniref:right-handed parallel beta-helix repeat-containing protein n=1 Tax=Malonomonas rubra TaxID=57040 RepID=UPI0026F2170C|nr:right-handed parallel beta-helix repeat-containing protein [Malonomonas rubra]